MRVKNRKLIWSLSVRSLLAARKRNWIAVIAIALTALLFTSLFTILLSVNASYQTYQFRQLGGYMHGTFKKVTPQQIEAISAHRLVREAGVRTVVGTTSDGVFAKEPAEISYMDENCARWSYATPTTGRLPAAGREITMDTGTLELLGINPELGAEIPLTYTLYDGKQSGETITDTFTLVGWWDYDDLMPVHYINVSRDYMEQAKTLGEERGMEAFRTDLNVMMASSADIRGQMERVDEELGYDAGNIGVNWGYTTAQLAGDMDMGLLAAIAAFLLLVFMTGYLIIYNIFQISVTGDIRYYGLLKTIGVTSKQLRRIIRVQAFVLCAVGIPVGLLAGYGVGVLLLPSILSVSNLGTAALTVSASPLIFAFSALFALGTVLLSCARPGRQAGKVSPVEATRYTEASTVKKVRTAAHGSRVYRMAFANLGRNRKKTALVVLSLALSVVLLHVLTLLVCGFDMEQYLASKTCADFIVSSPDYFHFVTTDAEYLSPESINEIEAGTRVSLSGCGYADTGVTKAWMSEDDWNVQAEGFYGAEWAEMQRPMMERRGNSIREELLLEGFDKSLLDKLTVLDGDLSPLYAEDSRSIAVAVNTDDFGNVVHSEVYPAVGDTITVVYAEDSHYIDSSTGELCSEATLPQNLKEELVGAHEVEYTVCALIDVPYGMGYRYSPVVGYQAVLPVETLERDSGQKAAPLFYLFDTPDEETEAAAEQYLSELTADAASPLMYESKATLRAEFEGFRNMFVLLGGILCAIIALVGVLNFFNAVMTGILSRRREFAVLQAVGMTERQLRSMLIIEGLFYALSAAALAFGVSLLISPLAIHLMEKMFWFLHPRFVITPVLSSIPVFALLGWLIPTILYGQEARRSVVEQLRDAA